MYALIDAVSFYASAEKVFDPTIRKRPVVVLTNNDGCICAVCPYAKKLNIPKFQPYFKVKHLLDKHQVVVRSSNYELYADLSDRMMSVINTFSDNHHIYSIDESFLHFTGYGQLIDSWHHYGQRIRHDVWKKTKLPVGVGFGPTITLAKAANHAAKKFSDATGVAVINDERTRISVLKRMQLTDVWGIGHRLAKKLTLMGIHNAFDLSVQNPNHMRRQFSVVLERTINELNGIACLNWDEITQRKKEIFSTRSFGERVTEPTALKSALVSHCSIVAKKLRRQKSLAKRLVVFIHSSPFEPNFYKKAFIHHLPVASNDCTVFAKIVTELFPQLYAPHVRYHKCGIGAIELEDDIYFQVDLFTPSADKPKLMHCLDNINQRYGKGTLHLASEQCSQKWRMRRDFLSPRYTTHWPDIPIIKC